ncbi:MAG: hypothetical protein OXF79_24005 [Chloroflexi bacterium]|nr:hypothetical protein [Chloroflexota bacterium]
MEQLPSVTAAETHAFAERGWERSAPVTVALREIEAGESGWWAARTAGFFTRPSG